MTWESPPGWLQKVLGAVLHSRDRETILGDLLEEYREEQLPRLGSVPANFWYGRQVIGFVLIRLLGGKLVKQALIVISAFSALAGVWLGIMENILHHPGYVGRSVVDGCIVAQGLVTLLFFVLHGASVFRAVVITGAVAVALFGVSAVARILQAQHFEGYVLLIGSALVLQGGLTLLVLLRTRYAHTV